MTVFKYLLLALVFPATVAAQRLSHPVMVSRDDAFSAPRQFVAAPETVRVLAVLVQFQKDADPRTTGDGQLVLSAPTDSIIDSPPRNAQYFRDHLTFLHNYYLKASKGKVIIESTVIDSIFTLPTPMSAYSPPKNGPNDAVANLVRDTWTRVDSSGLVADFSLYSCFIVFHAGVGRDIDLLSVLGYDPGPSDIPSLFFGLNALRAAYGPGYQGIPVNNGTFHITNSIVAPETESRTIPSLGGTVLLEFGINGLICSSLGNFLGLPDLFDTNTGRSGIGRFGLMDGQAIFSFSGVFPPLPSAWERYWLGWYVPLTAGQGTTVASLPAIAFADSVYRVPISNEEYFLVENRNRDPQRDGQRVWSVFNGVTRQQFFARDTTGFESGNIALLSGTITDVEDPDWSLPGGVDQNGTFYDGGVLIWHIDEAVIQQGLATDGVNANPDRRGVDLEEADGSQDIGQQYPFLTAGSGSEEGTALDFWYPGNGSPVNKNEFSTTSIPNSRSNGGANSHITIKDFSSRGPRMNAVIIRGDGNIGVLPGFPRSTGELLTTPALTVAALPGSTSPSIIVTTTGAAIPGRTAPERLVPPPTVEGKLYLWSPPSVSGLPPFSSSGLAARAGPDRAFSCAATVADTNADGKGDMLLVGQGPAPGSSLFPNLVRGLVVRDANTDSLADDRFSSALARQLSSPIVVGDSMIALGAGSPSVQFLRLNGTLIDSVRLLQDPSATVSGVSAFIDPDSFVITGSDGTVAITARRASGGTSVPGRVRNFGAPIAGPAATATFGTATGIAFVTTSGLLFLVDPSLNPFPGFPVSLGGSTSGTVALADIDGDGLRDIVVLCGSKIHAFNRAGVSLDHFPFTVLTQKSLTSSPVVADIDGDGNVDIVAVTSDGLVVAVNRKGTMDDGFPLQAGRGAQSAGVYTHGDSIIVLVVASTDDGSVSAWITGRTAGVPLAANYPWPQYQRTATHRGVDATVSTGTPLSSDFFPKDRAYNWPNPVYEGKTHIRYFVRENATVSIRIFDLAGDLVTSFPGPGIGGIDNEAEWDVSGVQSGVYFARIEANGSVGSGAVIVKVAVVK